MRKAIRNRNGSIAYYIGEAGKLYNKNEQPIRGYTGKDGRKRYHIYLNGKEWTATAYRLVAMAFYNDGYSFTSDIDIHHIDCNRTNNHYTNLMPLTKTEHVKLHNELRGK